MCASIAAEILGRLHAPRWRSVGAAPCRGILRVALVPGPRIPITEGLFLHLIEFGVELDDVVVRIAMIDENIMTDTMASWSPYNRVFRPAENVAGR